MQPCVPAELWAKIKNCCLMLRPKYILYSLGRFAFGKTPRGPRCARQARQRLAKKLFFRGHVISARQIGARILIAR